MIAGIREIPLHRAVCLAKRANEQALALRMPHATADDVTRHDLFLYYANQATTAMQNAHVDCMDQFVAEPDSRD